MPKISIYKVIFIFVGIFSIATSTTPTKPSTKPATKPSPSAKPTVAPAIARSKSPSAKPTTLLPSRKPSYIPSATPTKSRSPTKKFSPSTNPTKKSSAKPSVTPTKKTASAPPYLPTSEPTVNVGDVYNAYMAKYITNSVGSTSATRKWRSNFENNYKFIQNYTKSHHGGVLSAQGSFAGAAFTVGVTKFMHLSLAEYRIATGVNKFAQFVKDRTKKPTTKPVTKPTLKPSFRTTRTPSTRAAASKVAVNLQPTAKILADKPQPTIDKDEDDEEDKPKPSSRFETEKPKKVETEKPKSSPSSGGGSSKVPSPSRPRKSEKPRPPSRRKYRIDDGNEFEFNDDNGPLVPVASPTEKPSAKATPGVPRYAPTEEPTYVPTMEPISPSREPAVPAPVVQPTVAPTSGVQSPTFAMPTPPSAGLDWTTTTNPVQAPVVTPIKDQGQCGSCWAFSAGGAIEGAVQIKYRSSSISSYSEQQIVDCDLSQNACLGGWPAAVMGTYLTTTGLETEADYPYTGIGNSVCSTDPAQQDSRTMTAGVEQVANTWAAMKAALDIGPVSVTVSASSSVWQLYTGGILNDAESCGTSIDHAILAVGYGTDPVTGLNYIKCKNSWGTVWGEAGYVRIWADENANTCQIYSYSFYPVLK